LGEAVGLGATTTYTYATNTPAYLNPHAPQKIGTATSTYDNNGNLTGIITSGATSTAYTWDYNNRLTQASSTGVSVTYTYDPWGQRVKQTQGATTTIYSSKEYNITGSVPTKHIFLPDGTMIATIVGTGTTTTVSYIHTDHLGGMNVATSEEGEIQQLSDYLPYGNIRIDEQSGFSSQRKFANYEFDPASNLNYLNQRYYNGTNARFLSQDPAFLAMGDNQYLEEMTGQKLKEYLSNPQNLNSYSYALNNPIVNTDPTGQSAEGAMRLAPALPALGSILYYIGGVIISYTPPVAIGGVGAVAIVGSLRWGLASPDISNQTTPSSILTAEGDANAQPEADTDNSNPFVGPVKEPVTVVDPKGNAIPVGKGEQIKTSKDGKWVDVKQSDGKTTTGTRIDNGHPASTHPDTRGQQPHAHRPGVTNPDGTPWLPIK